LRLLSCLLGCQHLLRKLQATLKDKKNLPKKTLGESQAFFFVSKNNFQVAAD
jgi:hypothetical protein